MWQKTLAKAWGKSQNLPEAVHLQTLPAEINVEKEWNLFMKLLSKIYKTATHDVAVHIQNPLHEKELLQKFNQVGKNNGKRTQPTTIQKINNATKNAGLPHTGQTEKRVGRRLARLYALRTLLQNNVRQNHDLLQNCPENTQTLVQKLWKNKNPPHTTLGTILRDIQNDILSTTTDRQRAEEERKNYRLTNWKSQFREADVKTIAQWIRKKEQRPATACVRNTHGVAQTDS